MPKPKGRSHKPVERNGVLLLGTGELAKQTGETLATIRHWTFLGLLRISYTSESGYKFYDPSAITAALEIRRLRSGYLSLKGVAMKMNVVDHN